MLEGHKLIITPLEGGGYEVSERIEPTTVEDVVAGIGALVVTVVLIGGIIWAMDRVTDRMIGRIR